MANKCRPRDLNRKQLIDWCKSVSYKEKQPDNIHKLKEPCLIWPRGVSEFGYGIIFFEGKRWYIMRLIKGLTWHDGKVVMHLCDREECIEETHLKVIKGNARNSIDMAKKQRSAHIKVSNIAAKTIRKMAEIGFERRVIADLYDISRGHVWQIAKKKRRQHI